MLNTNNKFNRTRLLRFIYGGIGLILLILAISIPQLIHTGTDFNNYTIAKEVLQEILIAAMAASIWLSAKFYQKNMEQLKRIRALKADKGELEANLLEAVKHIGSMNVQLDAVRGALTSVKEYPKSKEDFKNVLAFFAEKLMVIANADWLIIRLIDSVNGRTIREHVEIRGNQNINRPEVRDQCLLSGECDGFCAVSSDQDNLTIKAFCALPEMDIKKGQADLIKAVLNQLEMIFIIYSSKYYKDAK
ncbi:MAG: hypothetical protein WCO55_05975 [Candidatus Falkowbacteria bacterium]